MVVPGARAARGVRIDSAALDSPEWSALRKRSLELVRRSRDPVFLLNRMREKAAAILGLDLDDGEPDSMLKKEELASACKFNPPTVGAGSSFEDSVNTGDRVCEEFSTVAKEFEEPRQISVCSLMVPSPTSGWPAISHGVPRREEIFSKSQNCEAAAGCSKVQMLPNLGADRNLRLIITQFDPGDGRVQNAVHQFNARNRGGFARAGGRTVGTEGNRTRGVYWRVDMNHTNTNTTGALMLVDQDTLNKKRASEEQQVESVNDSRDSKKKKAALEAANTDAEAASQPRTSQ